MAVIVVPYRDSGKRRLRVPGNPRELSRAMLEDVLSACAEVGRTLLVTSALVPGLDVELVPDPGGGQGAAVEAALAALDEGPALVVNSDLPCARPGDLLDLLAAVPAGGLALVPAADGTTNALALSSPSLFRPLYGPGSAARFLELAPSRSVAISNLADDVDTLADLERLRSRAGPRTQLALASLQVELAR